ncbi:MAG: coproporphyrinogen dehydrogenase HemZ [Clostridiales bacterium]|nr:coproporphyrinogen dehydrogenase HemZ [Clostridiales bacterium]
MIKTNLVEFENDLKEVLMLYPEAEATLTASFFDEKMASEVIINDKKFNYSFDLVFKDKLEEKRLKKRYAKLSLYKALSSYFEREMPWGALTGIRPTKLAYMEKEKGDFEKFFKETMLVSNEKTTLIKDILDEQVGIYERNDNSFDLFVSIPFCPSRCTYCSFISGEIGKCKNLIPAYIDALVKEIEESKKLIKELKSVYIGGGTPVALETEDLRRILEAVGKQTVEYTVEAGRPDAITKEKLELLKEYGVSRICVNPQTFNDKTLALIGRKHTANDIIETYSKAKEYFSINMDLIAGLPEETVEDFKNTLDKTISLRPDNITVHTLCIKRGSKLAESVKRLDDSGVKEMTDYASNELRKAGYKPYYLYRQKYMTENLENTGYSLKGKACVYNINIMEEISNIVANGANAVSKRVFNGGERLERTGNPKDIKTYIEKIDKLIEDKNKLFG